MLTATVNGTEKELADTTTLGELLASLGISLDGTAVAVNDAVVPRAAYAAHRLHDGDRVEIIRAVSGG
jgi:sulfur carrier protein